jgi:methylenetetrahydrofolate dehydrogenase (NADP+) / methenyltetrahydrofolate cyclohydrolase
MIIDGKASAALLRREIAREVSELRRKPSLAVVLVGSDPASEIYVRNKGKATREVGMNSIEHRLSDEIKEAELLALIQKLNYDDAIDGILVQLPLPAHIDPKFVINAIDPAKDVDGFHPYNIGRLVQRDPAIIPCTPRGCLHLLKEHLGEVRGLHAVMVGASNIVGRPMAQLLLLEGCTVTVTHRFTADSAALAREADIIVAAAGKPGLVSADWVKPGATVIDVGINRLDSGKIVGDVDFDAVKDIAGGITPVPGGVGPMTIAMLLLNTLEAYGSD